MGYLADYEHDVFISYAHGPQLSPWSQALCEQLTNTLNDALERKGPTGVNVWMDDELEGNVGLTEQLKARIEGSAVIVIIMSSLYLDSPWCAQEAKWFAEICKRRTDGGDRLFVVRYRETDEKRWPDFLKDSRGSALSGYRFYARDRNAEADIFPFGYPTPENADQDSRSKYYAAIRNLAENVTKKMRQIANAPAPAPVQAAAPLANGGGRIWNNIAPAPSVPAGKGPVVYLGVGTEDVDPELQDMRTKLTAAGFEVIPAAADATAAGAQQILSVPPSNCTQAVFVLGGLPGRSTPIDGEDLVAWQVAQAKAAGWKIAAWLPPPLVAATLRDAKYRGLVEQLQPTQAPDAAAFVGQLPKPAREAVETGRLVFLDLPEAAPKAEGQTPQLDKTLRAILRELKVGVLPLNRFSQQGRDLAAVERLRQELRQKRADCDGIMLLLDDPNYMPEDWLIDIYRDVLPRAKRNLRCAVLDAVGSDLTSSDELMVFKQASPSLRDEIQAWLTQ
jgi:hypothetical protein